MKFLVLALALLLAVGCQAAALPSESPSQLDQARAVVRFYLEHVVGSLKRIVGQLDDAEYGPLKAQLSQGLDNGFQQYKAWQASVSPLTDNFVKTVSEATAELRGNIDADIKSLGEELAPKIEHLKEVIEKHLEAYKGLLGPIMKEHRDKHSALLDELRANLESVKETFKTMVTANVEETKAALIPILQSLLTKVSERGQELKNMAAPYVEEYKTELQSAYEAVKQIDASEMAELRAALKPKVDSITQNIQEMYDEISGALSKQS